MTSSLTHRKKWTLSFIAAALFIVVSSPIMYKGTDTISEKLGFNTTEGTGPTWEGLLIHTVVFFLLIRIILAFAF